MSLSRLLNKNQRGASLIEVMVALVLLSIIAVAFLGGLSTAFKANYIVDERSTAQSLAQSQMEYIKSQDYKSSGAYAELDEDDVPEDYDIDLSVESIGDGLQKITAKIYHNDDEHAEPPLFALEGYKGERE